MTTNLKAAPKIIINDTETEYRSILEYAMNNGFNLPTIFVQKQQNNLIKYLKAHNIWDNRSLLYVFAGDGDENFACINWISPGDFQATRVGGLTYTLNAGFYGNGTNAYINTNHRPILDGSSLYTLNNAHCHYFSLTPNTQTYLGVESTATSNALFPQNNTGSVSYRFNSNTQVTYSFPNLTQGDFSQFAFNRPNSGSVEVNINDLYNTSQLLATTNLFSGSLYLLARNRNGTTIGYSSGNISMLSLGRYLNSDNTSISYQIFSEYFNSLR
jgi:hypothetical protein